MAHLHNLMHSQATHMENKTTYLQIIQILLDFVSKWRLYEQMNTEVDG